MRTSLRYASLTGYAELSRSLGLDPEELMRAADLDLADLATPEKWVPGARVARLLEMSARRCGAADFALRLAAHRRLSTLGPLSLVLRQQADLRTVLEILIRYTHCYNEALRIRLTEADGLAVVRLWLEFGEPAPTRQADELAVAALHGIIRDLAGARWQPLAACFTHAAPMDLQPYQQFFGCRPRFGHGFAGLVLHSADLDLPIAAGSAPGGQTLEYQVAPRGNATAGRVRDLVEVLLPTGHCSAEEAARALGMDRRTLHRHLAATNESFTSIVDSVRATLAERYLAGERYRLAQISELLGFAAPSAFTRWFHRKFGTSPTQWRRRAELP